MVLNCMVDLFLKYLQYEKRFSSHTLLAYKNDLRQFEDFLTLTSPDRKSQSADYGDVRGWIVHLVESGLDAPTVNRKIACLRSYYKFLLRENVVLKDPTMKIRVLKTRKRLPHFVNEPDMVKLLDHADFEDSHEGWRERLILELFYGTGMRLSELINLKESQINLRECTIKVLGKRNKERVIPFAKSIVPIIENYRRARDREVEKKDPQLVIVSNSGGRCYPMLVQRTVKRYLSLFSSTEKKSPHVLRHSYATHLLDKGAEINAVKDLLGHSSLAATQVYTHNSMEKLKKTFDQAHPKA